jgi:hypothetical protein
MAYHGLLKNLEEDEVTEKLFQLTDSFHLSSLFYNN